MNIELIFQIAGIGILTAIFHTILKQAEKEEYAFIATLAGVSIALLMVVQLLAELLETVKGVFFL
ncbi:MAG TPA: stage III sporulation protein AC [Peptococcaceae bacterium]|jgi:stage III sporulation protein AC|nr:stage III sporulation protein AC [Clostridia bacterium]HOB81522.1 stage III sporulation protein AC [Peptococcaceae bacterium]HPZ71754.1 stage III sporulation protein AC [Peptococcaceae bacterium]HQD53610.1 stage III sporulation protein AC [Peptococcaceae bacterium]